MAQIHENRLAEYLYKVDFQQDVIAIHCYGSTHLGYDSTTIEIVATDAKSAVAD